MYVEFYRKAKEFRDKNKGPLVSTTTLVETRRLDNNVDS